MEEIRREKEYWDREEKGKKREEGKRRYRKMNVKKKSRLENRGKEIGGKKGERKYCWREETKRKEREENKKEGL